MVKKSEENVNAKVDIELDKTSLTYYRQSDISRVNEQIALSLKNNKSKQGGDGGGIPDRTIHFTHQNENWIAFIENKSGKKYMSKLEGDTGFIDNLKSDGQPSYKQVISKFALNGAYYYAKNAYHDTDFKNYLVIGVCGEQDPTQTYSIDVEAYVITPESNGIAIRYGSFNDFAFLQQENLAETVKGLKNVHLTAEQKHELLIQSEKSIDEKLNALNHKMWNKLNIDAKWRINMVVAMVLAGLGDSKNDIYPLKLDRLEGSKEEGQTDADIIIQKIKNLLSKRNLPPEKVDHIVRMITLTIKDNRTFNERDESGETINKILYRDIQKDILPFVENKLLDFAGIVYNKVTDWMGLADDEKNDVVLTPRYVIDLMVKLARVNYNSYVWDFALGSGGFLISAMNEMLRDAKENEHRLDDGLKNKQRHIKEKQLLGIEKRSDIQMLAILNMLLVGDGSSNIINSDSLTKFDGNYMYPKNAGKFPANVFLLNLPYSEAGNGMVFVKKALGMMTTGTAAIIIQDSAGSGKAVSYNKEILENNTLTASIKMPIDIFIGKSSVQTSIYVFEVGKPHAAKHRVKFIDFRNDGYSRSNRKKSGKDVNLRDTDDAVARYQEVANLVLYGAGELSIFTADEYIEDIIDPENGADWNFDQHKKIDTIPKLTDFKKTVADYLAWEVSNILKGQGEDLEQAKKFNAPLVKMLSGIEWGEFKVGDLFEKRTMKGFPKKDERLTENKDGYHIFGQNIKYQHPQKVLMDKKYLHWVDEERPILAYTSSVAEVGMIAEPFYRSGDNGAFQGLFPKFSDCNKKHILYLWAELARWFKGFGYATSMADLLELKIYIPYKDGKPDFQAMERFVELLEADRLRELEAYLTITGLNNITLTESEQKALDVFENLQNDDLDQTRWHSFAVTDVFMVKNTKCILSRNIRSGSGKIPYLTASSLNNAVNTYINYDENYLDYGNCVFIGGKTFVVTYQKNDFFSNDSHNLALYAKDIAFDLKSNHQLFFATTIESGLKHFYSWGDSISNKKIHKDRIWLPITDTGELDNIFMDDFISAIKKLVIAGVVDYAENKLNATREIISR